MAYYTALITAWNGATQPPTGVTGTALTGLTTANKIIAVNGWTIIGPSIPAIFSASTILNACVAADIASLTTAQVTLLTLMLSGGEVDGSKNTTVRAAVQAIFAGKTTTLANLGALVAPYDSPVIPWWSAPVASGGAGLNSTVSGGDLAAAGGLS